MIIKVDMPEIDKTNHMLTALLQAIEQLQGTGMKEKSRIWKKIALRPKIVLDSSTLMVYC